MTDIKLFDKVLTGVNKHFPEINLKFKDQSFIMKVLSVVLFFNTKFSSSYTTTIGNDIYFPNQSFINTRQVSSVVIILHEMMHVMQSKKLSKPLFGFLYLFPQILAPFCLPLLFVLTWKIVVPVFIFLLLPLPALFRAYFEKQAYMVSLYVINRLNNLNSYNIDIDSSCKFFLSQFKTSGYYFMYLFPNLDTQFSDALVKVKNNQRPYDHEVFDIIDDILN